MANSYTGIYAKTLTMADFDTSQFDGLAITAGVPVTLTYTVKPGQRVALGSGSSSLNGVCTAKIFQIKPMNSNATPAYVACNYTLLYSDSNDVNQTTLKQDLTDNCNTAPSAYSADVQAVAARLPETVGLKVGAYAHIKIVLTPIATDAVNTFDKADTVLQIPVTVYTLANASGQ